MDTWKSVIPPVVTVLMAITTKRIIPSLSLGLIAGGLLLSGGIFSGLIKATDYLAKSLNSLDSVYIVLFLFLFGALTEICAMSGGIKGFSKLAEKYVKTERGALLSVWAITPITFLDCCFHGIAAGTVAKPMIERVKGSKERLAFILNVTSGQLIVLIPLATTYVGYIVGVLTSAMRQVGLKGSAYALFLGSIPFNFYSIGTVLLALLITLWGLGFGKWRIGAVAKQEGGVHDSHEAHEECQFEQKVKPRVTNLIMPLLLLVGLVIYLFWLTGRGSEHTVIQALMNAQFERALFIATFITVVITSVFYALQGIPMREIEGHFLSGGAELLPPIVVLIMSWALSDVTQALGFNQFVLHAVSASIPRILIPATVFLIGGLTSYFIGSSWASWALIMPLGLNLAVGAGVNPALMVGAVLAGGSIGDHVSMLGETPILTSAVTDLPLLDHIQTSLPYALIIASISMVLYTMTLWFLR